MTPQEREVMQMALDVLELVDDYVRGKHEAKEALYEALAQPEHEWQGLTDEERQEYSFCDPVFGMAASSLVRVIEAKLREKNT